VASVFVSHSSRDRQATRQVSDGLRAAGFGALFVDFDPDLGIPGGRNWEQELYTRLRRADAMVFLASAASVASQWCFAEISLARSLGRPLIPVRLEPDVRMPLLDMVQWIDIADARSGFSRLVDGLRSAGLNPEQTFAWNPDRPPYPGLASFDGADAAVFFGRERETARLVELLQPTLRHGSGRFVAIVGPSGSGKSSLLRAGLLPRLTGRAGRWIPLPPLRPAERPVAQLARCLADAFADHGRPCAASELVAVLGRGPSGLVQLARELAELGRSVDGQPDVLIVIDQAEELLTRCAPEEQRAFLALLGGALGENSPIWAVATLRSEFLSAAPERAGLAEIVDDTLVIEPLSRSRLAEVIAKPAWRAGLEFAPSLIERMVHETAGGDALPLLAYTLRELAERAGPDGRIDADDY
jgi:energy-coupling factor transporter ATP-binding protein EcfA2